MSIDHCAYSIGMKTYDVAIAGAGIIGLSIAWQLARRSRLKVVVLEKGAAVGEGSTGASSAVCRFRYSSDAMVYLARDGINAYRNWADYTELDEPRATFQADGVLWMPGSDTSWAGRENSRMQTLGIATEVLDDKAIVERFPAFSTCTLCPDVETGEDHDCVGGSQNLYEVDGGCFDPVSAVQDLVEACRARGVDVRFRSPVAGIDTNGGCVTGLSLPSGERISTPLLINAAGPWCGMLNAMLGLDTGWDLVPTRIQVLYRDRPEELQGHIPVSVDMAGGIYFRTQNRGQQLIVGSVLEEDEREVVENPDDFQTEIDADFELKKLHILHHRFPGLPYRGSIRGYCGLYTTNRDDVHPILGPTAIDGYWVANGFSGHGFKLGPAIGSQFARAIAGEWHSFDTEVPMDVFSIDRSPIRLESKSVLA